MEVVFAKSAKRFAAVGAMLGWVAVGLQLYLLLLNRTASVPETLIRFFSFFTILTNILAAVGFSAASTESGNRSFFSRQATLSATTVYILVVGIIYNLVLHFTWQPQGLQKLVDELLHTILPLLFLFFWIRFVPKAGLQWGAIFGWMLYPLCYLIYVLIRGAASGFYPYPFINVTEIGYTKAIINSAIVCGVFLFLSVLLIAIGRQMAKRK